MIALLSVFAQQELVEELLRRGRTNTKGVRGDTIHASDVSQEALKKSALFGLADQMGEEMEGVRGSALRQSTALLADLNLQYSTEFLEPHRRLLVATALHASLRKETDLSNTHDLKFGADPDLSQLIPIPL